MRGEGGLQADIHAERGAVGRDTELAAVERALSRAREGFSALLLEGEAGIGKTTVLQEAQARAETLGFHVLACRPGPAEAALSLAAVADLLEPVPAERWDVLPAPLRHSLEVALLLAEPDGRPVEQRAVAAGVRTLVGGLSADRPVLLALDDVQWLDRASAAILEYVVRRFGGERVALLATRRLATPARLDLGALLSEDVLDVVHVGPLSLGALQRVLRQRLGTRLARPTLVRLHATAGGNPLFALELARALPHGTGVLGTDRPTFSSNLDDLLAERLDGLGASATEVVFTVAALAHPTVPLVHAAVGDAAKAGLAEALSAQILSKDGERIAFTHPLLAGVVSARQAPSARLELHAGLAAIVPTEEERARHLAFATAQPDAPIASILEAAARAARARGAPASAAELAEEAVRLTPPADVADARRRLVLAATSHDTAGDHERALSLLERTREDLPAGLDRARVVVAMADVHDDPRVSVPLYRQALEEVDGDRDLEASIHIRLATAMAWSTGVEQGMKHAALAARAASGSDDDEIRCRALAVHADWRFRSGHGIAEAEMEEASELERALANGPLDRGPTDLLARELVWTCDVERARPLLLGLREAHTARGDPDGQASAAWWLSFLEWRAGMWDEAERHATESLDLRLQLGNTMPVDGFPGAVLAAHRGRIEEARLRAGQQLAEAEAMDMRIAISNSAWVLGFVELSVGDHAAALPHLQRAYELRNDFMLEPAQRLELGDLVETLVALDALDEADELISRWQERAAALRRAWSLAILGRCRALLAVERRALDDALAHFEAALAAHRRTTDPFQEARTLLALGRVERRAKRRGAARATLEDAAVRFERLGAPLWVTMARAELSRIGGRRPATAGELTRTERRVVELAADGLSNKEIAATLFVTVHTIEVHLSRAYRKLGVRSRTQLARVVAESRGREPKD